MKKTKNRRKKPRPGAAHSCARCRRLFDWKLIVFFSELSVYLLYFSLNCRAVAALVVSRAGRSRGHDGQ